MLFNWGIKLFSEGINGEVGLEIGGGGAGIYFVAHLSPWAESERTPLRDALGRVLAEDVAAPFDVPGFDNSAMDGHACRIADLPIHPPPPPVRCAKLARRCRAAVRFRVGEGECARIMTGARIPKGADIVIPQEETDSADGKVLVAFWQAQARNAHSSRRRDLREGEVALSRGNYACPPTRSFGFAWQNRSCCQAAIAGGVFFHGR